MNRLRFKPCVGRLPPPGEYNGSTSGILLSTLSVVTQKKFAPCMACLTDRTQQCQPELSSAIHSQLCIPSMNTKLLMKGWVALSLALFYSRCETGRINPTCRLVVLSEQVHLGQLVISKHGSVKRVYWASVNLVVVMFLFLMDIQ